MTTQIMLRVLVATDAADAARNRAETEGKTLAEAVNEMLEAYAKAKPKRGKAT